MTGRHNVENYVGSSQNAACHYLSRRCKDLTYLSKRAAKHTLLSLITELGFLYSSLASWVDAYNNNVSGLQKSVLKPRNRSREKVEPLTSPTLFCRVIVPRESHRSHRKNLLIPSRTLKQISRKMYKHHATKMMSSDIGA
jgi:hypothetical protein